LSLSVKGIAPGSFPPLFNNIVCSENNSMLLQCVGDFGIYGDCENGTAAVICEIPNTDDNTNSMPMTTSVSVSIIKIE
jgi:hypothetical protein